MDASKETDDTFDKQQEKSHVSALDFTQKTWKDNVTFIVEGKPLYAAKNVLALVSPVFESMFSSSFKEKDQDEIELPGKKFDDFKEFLHFVYPTSSKTVDEDNVFRVLPLAEEYQVTSLKRRCRRFLRTYLKEDSDHISAGENLKCYLIGKKHGIEGIEDICVKKMCRQGKLELEEEDVADVDKYSLLEYHNDMLAHFSNVYADLHTRYVKSLMANTPKFNEAENVPGFENSMGTTIEHSIEDIFDLSVNESQLSKQVSVWSVKFYIKASISTEKCLSVYLCCDFPVDNENWICEVNFIMCLKVTRDYSEKTVVNQKASNKFKQGAPGFGYAAFRKMTDLIGDLSFSHDAGGKSVKIVVYLLANKPVKAE